MEAILINKRSKEKEELIDIALFTFALLLSVFLSFRNITDGKEDFGKLLQPYYLWPLVLLYLADIALLAYRRKKYAQTDFYHTVLGPLFLTYFGLRLIGYLFFPLGEQTFLFEWEREYFSIDYPGFGWYERMAEWIQEMLAVSIIYIMFVYYPSFRNFRKQLLFFYLFVTIMIAVIALIASFILDLEQYEFNLKLFLGQIQPDGNGVFPPSPAHDLQSFFTNRNVFGFFLGFAVLSLCVLNLLKPNFIWTLLAVFFIFFHLLVFSRSTLLISGVSLLLILILTPIFNWRKKKLTSILDICVLLLFVLLLILLFTVFKDTPLGKGAYHFLESFKDKNTVIGRRLLTQAALYMLENSLFFVLFGFGKTPFFNIFLAYQQAHGGEMLATAHNSWISALVTTGVVGLVFVIILDLIVVWMIIKTLYIKRYDVFITFGILGLALVFFGLYDPQMMFFTDAFSNSPLVFYLSFLFPIFYYYVLCQDTIEMKKHVPQELVYPMV